MSGAGHRTRTLIIVPAFNEAEAIGATLADLAQHIPEADVIVIDDGSRDATVRVAKQSGAIVASLPFNMGIGAALRTGFRFAQRHGYDRAAQFDADGQHKADQLGLLLSGLDEGADLVIGSRFAGSGAYHVGQTRGLAMAILRRVLRSLTGEELTDTSSGFRAFSRCAIEAFSDEYPREYMDSVEAIVIAARRGLRVKEVPVIMQSRQAGIESNRSFRLAFHYIRLLIVLATKVSMRKPREQGVSA